MSVSPAVDDDPVQAKTYDWQLLKRLLTYLRPHLGAAAAALPTGWAYETIGRGPWFAGLAGVGLLLYLVGASLGRDARSGP